MKKLNFAILLSIFLCWNNAQAEDIFGNSELEFVTEDETVSEDTSWRRKDDEDNKFLSSFLSSKITASTAKNINDAEKIFCYTVDYAPADYKGYLINDLALKGSCGEISETGKSLFKNTLFNNNSAYSNNIESCNISPKIMLRFVNGIDYTDVLLSTTKWFQFDTVDEENLVAMYSFTLKVGNGTQNDASIASTVKQVALTYTDSAVDSLISSNYVKAPVFSAWWGSGSENSPCVSPTEEAGFAAALLAALTTGTNAVSSSSVEINIKIEYDWGSVFNNDNPYDFFNGTVKVQGVDTPITGSTVYSKTNEKTVTYKDLAVEALGAIDAAFQTSAEEKLEQEEDYEYTMILSFESVSKNQ